MLTDQHSVIAGPENAICRFHTRCSTSKCFECNWIYTCSYDISCVTLSGKDGARPQQEGYLRGDKADIECWFGWFGSLSISRNLVNRGWTRCCCNLIPCQSPAESLGILSVSLVLRYALTALWMSQQSLQIMTSRYGLTAILVHFDDSQMTHQWVIPQTCILWQYQTSLSHRTGDQVENL